MSNDLNNLMMQPTVTQSSIEAEERKLELQVKMFELKHRQATALSKSAFFPDTFKGDVASAMIVYDLASRMNISELEVSQNVYIIYGRPSFSTQFMVARLNQSGRIRGTLKTIISNDKQSCYCTAIDNDTGEEVVGMTITMEMAKAEGWVNKKGSKWQTMPERMLRKRAQSFFIREFYPEVVFGMQSQEEIVDTEVVEVAPSNDLNAIAAQPQKDLLQDIETTPAHDESTGEVEEPNLLNVGGEHVS